jgi:hypothetical protein
LVERILLWRSEPLRGPLARNEPAYRPAAVHHGYPRALAHTFQDCGELGPESLGVDDLFHESIREECSTQVYPLAACFDFLGFTHQCAPSRRGELTVHVKTTKKRLRRSQRAVSDWYRQHRHDDVAAQQRSLNAKMRGHYQCCGRSSNYRSLWQFSHGVLRQKALLVPS